MSPSSRAAKKKPHTKISILFPPLLNVLGQLVTTLTPGKIKRDYQLDKQDLYNR
jgi:hypothetical protein